MPDLIDLPLDIKTLVVGHLNRYADKKALYSTCKDLYGAVIPTVYNAVDLLEDIPIAKLCSFLNLDNPGLGYVRHIRILPNDAKDKAEDRAQYKNVLSMLANQLPKDILLSFRYDTQNHVESSIARLLHKRQRHLRTLRYQTDLMDLDPKKPLGIKTNAITTLQILITAELGLAGARNCIHDSPKLETLELCLDSRLYCKSKKTDYLSEEVRIKASEEVMTALVTKDPSTNEGGAPQDRPVDSMRIRILRLSGFHMSRAASWIVRAVSIAELTALSITNCERETVLLQNLAATDTKCEHLRHLELIAPLARSRLQAKVTAIDDFLGSFNSLETLVVSTHGTLDLQPDLKRIAGHRRLRSLYLDFQSDTPGSNGTYYAPNVVAEELGKCRGLEQLALNFPQIDHDTDISEHKDLQTYITTLEELTELRTVRILDLPSPDNMSRTCLDGGIAAYYMNTVLMELAREFLELPKTTVVSVGKQGKAMRYGSESFSIDQRTHGLKRCVDLQGTKFVEGDWVQNRFARENEPLSDIIDLDPTQTASFFLRYWQR